MTTRNGPRRATHPETGTTLPKGNSGAPGATLSPIAAIVDDRWRTLTIGVLPGLGTETLSGLADRLYDPVFDIACRMVQGLAGHAFGDDSPEADERERELMARYDAERDAVDHLCFEISRTIEDRVKAFAVATLEARGESVR